MSFVCPRELASFDTFSSNREMYLSWGYKNLPFNGYPSAAFAYSQPDSLHFLP